VSQVIIQDRNHHKHAGHINISYPAQTKAQTFLME